MRWGKLMLILSLPAWPVRGQPVRTQATSVTAACSFLEKAAWAQAFHSTGWVYMETLWDWTSMQMLCVDNVYMQALFCMCKHWRHNVHACIHCIHICRHWIHIDIAYVKTLYGHMVTQWAHVCICMHTICIYIYTHTDTMHACVVVCECRHFAHLDTMCMYKWEVIDTCIYITLKYLHQRKK